MDDVQRLITVVAVIGGLYFLVVAPLKRAVSSARAGVEYPAFGK
jgi:hypothetical protein